LLTDKQRGVLLGMAAGLVATLAALALAITARPTLLTPTDDYAASVVHALRWDVLIGLCLTANIGLRARHRFFTPEDIDGGGLTKGTAQAQVLQATLQNTLEQTVLALSVHAVWAAEMPASWQGVIPAAAILFFIGRVLFWRGYAHGAPGRAPGFALTFYPTVAMLLLIVARLVVALFQ